MQYISCIVERNKAVLFLIIIEEKEDLKMVLEELQILYCYWKMLENIRTPHQEFLVLLQSGAN